jgi:hypothetical protein
MEPQLKPIASSEYVMKFVQSHSSLSAKQSFITASIIRLLPLLFFAAMAMGLALQE